jgi:hypothetical protein
MAIASVTVSAVALTGCGGGSDGASSSALLPYADAVEQLRWLVPGTTPAQAAAIDETLGALREEGLVVVQRVCWGDLECGRDLVEIPGPALEEAGQVAVSVAVVSPDAAAGAGARARLDGEERLSEEPACVPPADALEHGFSCEAIGPRLLALGPATLTAATAP